MITLYAFGQVHASVHGLTRDLRIEWALEELELPYHVRPLDHTGGEMTQPAFAALSPFHQVPVIDDDGFVLTESGAILMYLAEKAGKLLPKDAQGRATVSRWCYVALTTIEPLLQTVGLIDAMKLDRATRDKFAKILEERMLRTLETWLGDHTYATGENFTVADVLLTTVLRQARRAHLLEGFPRCEAYRRRCEDRPAWARAVAAYETRVHAAPGAVARAAEPQ